MTRASHGSYHDPLDLVWLHCAGQLGWRVTRSDEAYASWDGSGTLTLCTPATFDADDSLAQLLLHEICHALVQGPDRLAVRDWGLDNSDDRRAEVAEHACHRLQAALLDEHGLRDVLAVTTDWRPYWDALPADSLADGPDPAIPLAREAWNEARRGPWSRPLAEALRATADLADTVKPHAPPGTLWARARGRNALGVGLRAEGGTCGTCAWGQSGTCSALPWGGTHPRPVQPAWAACVRFTPRLDEAACMACGACCREAYDAVSVEEDDPVLQAHPELVELRLGLPVIARPGGTCRALCEGGPPWRCGIYANRPRSCREFEPESWNCLEARRRIGITRAG